MYKLFCLVMLYGYGLRIICLQGVSATAEAKIPSPQNKGGDLDTWIAPKSIISRFPYYVSGFDHEKRPVFVVEIGNWPLRSFIEKGGQELQDLSTYLEQMFHRMELGPKVFFNESERVANDMALILDWNNFSLTQFVHGPTTAFILGHFTAFQSIQESYAYGFFVNANAVASQLLNLARPILGSIMERTEVFGTQKQQWVPKILRKIPKSQIPAWYGGEEDFHPVAVFG